MTSPVSMRSLNFDTEISSHLILLHMHALYGSLMITDVYYLTGIRIA